MSDEETAKGPDVDVAQFLADKVKNLESRNSELRQEKRRLELSVRTSETERQRMERELKTLRSEMEKMRTPPLIVGYVKDVLEDGRIVLKSSTGPHFVVQAADYIDTTQIVPGTRVSLNQQTLSVVGVLPPSLDPLVYGAEVIDAPNVTYEDIGGLEPQIREVRETVELPMTRPDLFEKVGIDPPKGVLLYGPPGTGKTLLAKAVAHQTEATFIRLAGSELVQKYIGEGARLVRELFQMSREKAPTVLFIDELDAIGSTRYEASTSGDREIQRTLMQLLSEMDGFAARGDVKIIGATNRIDMLDSALLRPGRFDRIIEIPVPDAKAREQIFKIHTKRMSLAANVDLPLLATLCDDGTTGADIKAIATESGMFAIREERTIVEIADFHRAIEKALGKKFEERERVSKDAAFA
ncbi:MAG: proteasome-activating nucleotidase [Methanobacteriota archaeon]